MSHQTSLPPSPGWSRVLRDRRLLDNKHLNQKKVARLSRIPILNVLITRTGPHLVNVGCPECPLAPTKDNH